MAPEDGGETSHRPPPHPLDRPWIHPSELGTSIGVRRRRRARTVVSAMTAGLAAATGILLVAAVVLEGGTPASGRVVAGPAPTEAIAAAVVLVTGATPMGPVTASGVSLGDGQIVTGSQVAAHGSVTVVTDDGIEHDATVVGRDHESDLTLLRVDASLPSAPLGRADLLAGGDQVLAIAATGVGEHWSASATFEQRHALVKTDAGEIIFSGLLATDLPTSDSHAGGALVDGEGNVVGVLVTPPGTSIAGAAVPIEKVTGVCDQLRRRGKADHGWIGLAGFDTGGGVRIHEVVAASPAAKAGLRDGDVVVAAGRTELTGVGELAAVVRARRPGDDLHLEVLRDGRLRSVEVTLGSLDPYDRRTP